MYCLHSSTNCYHFRDVQLGCTSSESTNWQPSRRNWAQFFFGRLIKWFIIFISDSAPFFLSEEVTQWTTHPFDILLVVIWWFVSMFWWTTEVARSKKKPHLKHYIFICILWPIREFACFMKFYRFYSLTWIFFQVFLSIGVFVCVCVSVRFSLISLFKLQILKRSSRLAWNHYN